MSSKDNLRIALERLKAGQLPQAEALYQEVLRTEPGNAEALQFLGVIALQHSNYARAAQWLARAVESRPDYAQAHNNLGTALQALGRAAEARAAFGRALELQPGYAAALNNLGSALIAAGLPAEGELRLREGLRARPDNPRAHYNLGNALQALGRPDEAAAHYARALALKADFAEAANNLGGVLQKLGRFAEAEAQYQRVFELRPQEGQAQFNLARLAQEQAAPEEAMRRYRAALELEPGNPDAHNNLGNLLRREGRLAEAEACYRAALERAPQHAAARNNLGNILRDLGRLDEAKEWYAKALQSDAGPAEAYVNMAGILREKGRPEEALRWLQRALSARPDFPAAYVQLGNLLQQQGRRAEAATAFRHAHEAEPRDAEALMGLLHQSQHLCAWADYESLAARARAMVLERDDARVPPFAALTLELAPEGQLRCARTWARLGYAPLGALRERLPARAARPAGARLRVGYLSGDFRAHPVAYMCTGILELHQRAEFEVYGYGTGPDDGSATRARMIAACDRHRDLREHSYEEAARAIRADGIDVLVDLSGYTQWGRPGILALRPAPVQVSYLGFPGGLGADFADYLIADAYLVPPGRESDYAEQVVRLPAYLPSDPQRPRPARATRAEHGLPEDAFVFCCFNQSFKILPAVFDAWMRLLQAVPGSLLWLTESNEAVAGNLRREAAARGVDPARLAFAPWIQGDLARHYGRVALADLFLDTAPFNANVTASDALWCGVPVLSCAGETFAARAAGSLLAALGLPELIAASPAHYEERALELARAPATLAALRARLAAARESSGLFDAARYVRALESAFRAMHRRQLAGEPPAAIDVSLSDTV